MLLRPNNSFFVTLVVWCFCYLAPSCVSAQDYSDMGTQPKIKRNIQSLQLGFHTGFIFAQSKEVAYSKGSRPYGLEANIGWLRNDSTERNICNCYPKQGLSLSYFNLDNPTYGSSFSAAYFIEPSYRIGKKSFFFIKGNIGSAYLTKPYDSILNSRNRAYSSKVNFFLSLGVGLNFTIADKWGINSGINLQHISNAGTRLPNAGINWPTIYAAVSRRNKPLPDTKPAYKDKSWKSNPVKWEASIFGIAAKVTTTDKHKKLFPIIGAGIQAGKQVSNLNELTLGAEIISDKRTWYNLRKDSIFRSPIRMGVLAGNKFLLGKFYFSQRLGMYLYNQTLNPRLFHRWALQYKIDDHLGTGFSFLAHGKAADFFDIRFSYSL